MLAWKTVYNSVASTSGKLDSLRQNCGVSVLALLVNSCVAKQGRGGGVWCVLADV